MLRQVLWIQNGDLSHGSYVDAKLLDLDNVHASKSKSKHINMYIYMNEHIYICMYIHIIGTTTLSGISKMCIYAYMLKIQNIHLHVCIHPKNPASSARNCLRQVTDRHRPCRDPPSIGSHRLVGHGGPITLAVSRVSQKSQQVAIIEIIKN